MSEYTIKDVIIDPEDPRAVVGAEYYWGASPRDTVDRANNKGGALPLFLIDRHEEHTFPFYFCQGSLEGGSHFLIRKKESSYAERQEKWIEENDLNKGDRVRVTRKADSQEDGWRNNWNPNMDETVGKVGTVCHIFALFRDCGIEVDVPDVGIFYYPYFVLKKVGQKYVPFDLSDKKVRDELRGKWIIPKGHPDSIEKQITLFGSQMTEYGKIWCVDMDITPDKLLASWTFIDGTPCGKMEVKD